MKLVVTATPQPAARTSGWLHKTPGWVHRLPR